MGVFGEVYGYCPRCHKEVEFQYGSEIGCHHMGNDMPLEVVAEVDGQTTWCKNCKLEITARKKVIITLEIDGVDNESN